MTLSNQKFKAAAYLRLSKEDAVVGGKKAESDSITNQKTLISNFIKEHSDIKLVNCYIDDGYTGVLFDRPAFKTMLDDIGSGKINCVIVKDFSRFGREYINAGKYLQKLFPSLGVRFISVNDSYDSFDNNNSQGMLLSLKNLINDNYCRDISVKIRSVLDSKRKNGEFVNNYCPYGYKKCSNDHNKIEIDEYAAEVVKDIFNYIINGYSLGKIAEKLNELCIKTPMDYRIENGERISTNFRKGNSAKWSQNIVRRIAENPVYIGTLIQGKTTTPNYKLKDKRVTKDESEWTVIENHHEAVIDKNDFELVQKLLKLDLRTSPNEETLYPFAGILFCADCGAPMTRKVSTSRGKKYNYYICSTHKHGGNCTAHRIKEDTLSEVVLCSLQAHIKALLDVEKLLADFDINSARDLSMRKLQKHIAANEAETEKINDAISNLYIDFKSGMFDKEDFLALKQNFELKRDELKKSTSILYEELANISLEFANNKFHKELQKYKNIQTLSRVVVVHLIAEIIVYDATHIEVTYNFDPGFDILEAETELAGTEAV